jgi:hypothetical protein
VVLRVHAGCVANGVASGGVARCAWPLALGFVAAGVGSPPIPPMACWLFGAVEGLRVRAPASRLRQPAHGPCRGGQPIPPQKLTLQGTWAGSRKFSKSRSRPTGVSRWNQVCARGGAGCRLRGVAARARAASGTDAGRRRPVNSLPASRIRPGAAKRGGERKAPPAPPPASAPWWCPPPAPPGPRRAGRRTPRPTRRGWGHRTPTAGRGQPGGRFGCADGCSAFASFLGAGVPRGAREPGAAEG